LIGDALVSEYVESPMPMDNVGALVERRGLERERRVF